VGERLVSGGAEGLLSALPLAAPRTGRNRVGRWLREGEDARFAGRVLLDAKGRPLLHENRGTVLSLWRYEPGRTEQVDHLRQVLWVLGREGAVGADITDRWVQRWTWRGEAVVRVDRASAAPRGWASASATEADLDAAGALRALRDGVEENDYREDNRLAEDEWLPALEAALERAADIECRRRNWIAARDAPAPLRADLTGLAEELAGARPRRRCPSRSARPALPVPAGVEPELRGAHPGARHRPARRGPSDARPASSTPCATSWAEERHHVPVTFEPMLTVPNGWGAAGMLGLDVYEARAYEAVVSLLWEATGEPEWFGGQHWIGGHASGAQGETPEPGSVLLLHLADDSELGFDFLDAGTLQFRIPAEALARRDYGAVSAEPSSC
jgi:hypothetical protein